MGLVTRTCFVETVNKLPCADILAIATEWSEFRTPDFEIIEKELPSKVIFDGRNLFDVAKMKEMGYHYESIGRL